MKKIWRLFRAFFNIGLFTFGGGYAMIPMLQREVVERNQWTTEDELLNCYAIGQCTPGVIAVNTATYVGYKVNGVLGSAISTLAVVMPSFLIISALALVLRNFSQYAVINHAFAGIRVAVAVLVGKSIIGLYRKSVKGILPHCILAASLLLTVFIDLSPVILVLAAVILSVFTRKAARK